MSGPVGQTNTCGIDSVKVHTVGDMLSNRIAAARQDLENACIAKAKAETLQMLDWPVNQLTAILYNGPF